ncbi:MAG: hypothetical protein IJ572_00080 [Bacilli bacterium]|nr:hypothetical protein [Bacilli bacterium]
MNNKVLIKLDVFELNTTYDVFIPVNEVLWKVKAMIVKCVSDLEHLPFNPKEEFVLINKDNGYIYQSNEIVIDTNIRNGTELVLMAKV